MLRLSAYIHYMEVNVGFRIEAFRIHDRQIQGGANAGTRLEPAFSRIRRKEIVSLQNV